MARNKPKTILYRRKREQRTDYKKRLHLLLGGEPRIVVRFTNNRIIAQVITFTSQGDRVEAAVDSTFLRKHGWKASCKNIPAAYLTGLALAEKAKSKGKVGGVFDTGFRTPQHKGKVYAFLKGAVDGGLKIPHGSEEKIFPPQERLEGNHVAQHLKNSGREEDVPAQFAAIKAKLSKE